MGVACEVEVTRSRDGARLEVLCAAVPAAALGLACLQLLQGPTLLVEGPQWLRLAMAGVCLIGMLVLSGMGIRAWRERGSSTPIAALSVDVDGAISLSRMPGSARQPMALRASCVLPGLILLVVAPYPADPSANRSRRKQTLLLGRGGMSDDSWRKLKVWLRWMERGRHAMPATRPERT